MDQRLEAAVSTPPQPAELLNLCVYAVLYARRDISRPSTNDPFSDLINFQLASVLHQGFNANLLPDLVGWDADRAQTELLVYRRPDKRFHIAKRIGDRTLFVASQETWSDRATTVQRWQQVGRCVRAIGQLSYTIAGANAPDQKLMGPLYSCLSQNFEWFSKLLGHAGQLLGFSPVDHHLIHPSRPVVTTNDFLEALTRFSQHPTPEHWQALRQAAENHRYIDSNFTFELPPEPTT